MWSVWAGKGSTPILVPPGMRFLATINTDNTTEMLSDRMLSRACFVKVTAPEELALQSSVSSCLEGLDISLADINQAFYLTSEIPEIKQESAKKFLVNILLQVEKLQENLLVEIRTIK